MFISYLDASGRAEYEEKENYVLASITTNESSWQCIENGVKQIKLHHFPRLNDTDVEFHAKDMLNHDGIYKTLSWEEIYSIFDDIFNFISSASSELTIIAVVILKNNLRKKIDVETWAYRMLFERINSFLTVQNRSLILAQFPQQYGIMITDSEGTTKDQKLRNKLYEMLRNGTLYSKLDFLIEDPLFTDSKWRNLSQLADCVAYCIRKHFRVNGESFHSKHWDRYYQLLEKKFNNPSGSNYYGTGIKIFPS